MSVLDILGNVIWIQEKTSCLQDICCMSRIMVSIRALVVGFNDCEPSGNCVCWTPQSIDDIPPLKNLKEMHYSIAIHHRTPTFAPRWLKGWCSVTLSNSITSKRQEFSASRALTTSDEILLRDCASLPEALLWSLKASTTDRFRWRDGWCNWNQYLINPH